MEITFNNLDELRERANTIYMDDNKEEYTRYIAMTMCDVLRVYNINTDARLKAIKLVSDILFNKEIHTIDDIREVDALFLFESNYWPLSD